MEYLEMFVDVVNAAMEQWDGIEEVILRIIDLFETIGIGLVG